jgi:hypothetical protein
MLLEGEFTDDPWKNEALQRNALRRSFDDDDDDVFIVSDVDEINNAQDVANIVEQARVHGFVKLEQSLYYYKINLLVRDVQWARAFAVTGRYMRETGLPFDKLRKRSPFSMPTRGKHFSYLSGPDGISDKIKSFSHGELNRPEYTDPVAIEARIRDHVDPFDREYRLERVEVDDSYPATILGNLAYWEKYVC